MVEVLKTIQLLQVGNSKADGKKQAIEITKF